MKTDHFRTDLPLKKLLAKDFDALERWSVQREKILKLNSTYNAYITVFEKPVLQAGYKKRPLRGITVGVKDVFYVKGYRTTAGSKILENFVPTRNAVAVDKLIKAGALLNGKTNLHEFAFGVSNINPHFGPCRNPYDLTRVSGGSSGGSAVAVALGMCDVALGTDTAGSVRIPASFCGIVGFKPSIGSISTEGVIPLSWSLDHVGVLARNVWETALVYSVLAEHLPRIGTLAPTGLDELKVGVPRNYFLEHLDSDVRHLFEQALRRIQSKGAEFVEVEVDQVEKAVKCRTVIAFAESAAYHLKLSAGRLNLYGEDVKQRIVSGLAIPASAYLTALRARKKLTTVFRKIFNDVDIIATPTTIIAAHRIEEEEVEVDGEKLPVRAATLRNTEVFNLYGVPAISIPMGLTGKGLPVGLQLVSDVGKDLQLLRIAHAVEKQLKTSS